MEFKVNYKLVWLAVIVWIIIFGHYTWTGNLQKEIFRLNLDKELLELMVEECLNQCEVIGLQNEYEKQIINYREVEAVITAYNTVEWQTDSTPCIASAGYICGRNNVVACPRDIPLGTIVSIGGKSYECMDRTASKYDGRFDISFDKDIEGAKQFGKKRLTVRIYD